MEFTTRLGLHSQATRLREERTPAGRGPLPACHRPWAEPPSARLRPPAPPPEHALLRTLHIPRAGRTLSSVRYNSRARRGRGFSAGLFPLRSPLLGESWLVSFPPLSNMLKFS